MAIEVMMTVLAVLISATRTRPTTADIPSERAQQDEYRARVPARDNDGFDHQNINNIPAAGSRQTNRNHCPTIAHHTSTRVRGYTRPGTSGNIPLDSGASPAVTSNPTHDITTPQQQTNRMQQYAAVQPPETGRVGTLHQRNTPDRSPQEPIGLDPPSDRQSPPQRSSEQPPSMTSQRRHAKKRPHEEVREVNSKRDAEKIPQGKKGKENKPPVNKEPPQRKKKGK